MKEKKYVAEKIENFQTEIPVEEYMKECVDVATFLEFCKECSNYGKLWCCPPYTFDVEKDYWNLPIARPYTLHFLIHVQR